MIFLSKSLSDTATFDFESLKYENFNFGRYLRTVRQAKGISIRHLAKEVNKTPTYLSDIENGHNKPPEKELLEIIIQKLNLNDFPNVKTTLFDLAAKDRNDIPADIKEHMLNNKLLFELIRKMKACSNEDTVIVRIQNLLNEQEDTQ